MMLKYRIEQRAPGGAWTVYQGDLDLGYNLPSAEEAELALQRYKVLSEHLEWVAVLSK